jgi:NAD(P)H dehydrogenase (quinone)
MTKYVISGASGSLGGKIATLLLERVPAQDITLVTRTPDKLDAFKQRGVTVHPGDYNNPAALERAYAASDVLMMISSMAVTERIPEHRNAISAAKAAGIKHIVYTSTAGIHPQNPTLSASDHIVTEDDLRRCGLGYTIMRNACYAEVFPTVAAQRCCAPANGCRWRATASSRRFRRMISPGRRLRACSILHAMTARFMKSPGLISSASATSRR